MNLLGIDFEDWYHPELIQRHIKTKNNKPTVINGIDKILDWLRRNETLATFFVVGELLEIKPEIIDKIISNNHEIAFHSMNHIRMDSSIYNKEKFDDEVKRFSAMTSNRSKGFRAPSFSLNHSSSWVIDVLENNNYIYDSSIVPTKTKLYGMKNAEIRPYKISSLSLEKNDPKGKILEFPLMVTKFFRKTIPAAGGFYLRVLPLRMIENAIDQYNKNNIPVTFYIHSWELTPEYMPHIPLSLMDGFVTYHNLRSTLSKMDKIVKRFKFTSFEQYLK